MGWEETQGPTAAGARADGGGGNSRRPSREVGPRLRATGHSGAPPSRRGAPYSLRAGPAALRDSRRPGIPPPAGAEAREQSQHQRVRARLREPRSISLSLSPTASTSLRGGSQLPHRRGRPPARPRAYLVLNFGGEPIGRALVEVGHGRMDDWKGLRSDSAVVGGGGLVTLGVPALSPSGGPAGDARARSPARRRRSRNAADGRG